jgi:hypothetical protein
VRDADCTSTATRTVVAKRAKNSRTRSPTDRTRFNTPSTFETRDANTGVDHQRGEQRLNVG